MATESKPKRGHDLATTPKSKAPGKHKPNRNSIVMRPYKHVEMTKAEMYEDLRKAVENTK